MAFTGRLQELMKKYGKVAFGVHFSVSAAAITGFYVAIKNNVDVESIFEKVGLSSRVPDNDRASGVVILDGHDSLSPKPPREPQQQMKMTRTAELAASSGGTLALAIHCNKGLFPVRVPITIAFTPPMARLLARRNLLKHHVLPWVLSHGGVSFPPALPLSAFAPRRCREDVICVAVVGHQNNLM
nr:PREDICTED: uncharacterized protein LOC103977407 isoform X2 [Musa acuminata subsp. malaccensis]